MTTREDILSLCPFCGGRGDIEGADYDGPADCWDTMIACNDCDARGPSVLREHGDSRSAAIDDAYAAWNRRAAPTPPAAEAPGQEPVAEWWLIEHDNHPPEASRQRLTDGDKRAGFRERPMFAAPLTYADAEAKGLEKAAHVALDENYAAIAAGQAAKTEGQKYRAMGRSEAAIRIGDRIRSLASPAPKGET